MPSPATLRAAASSLDHQAGRLPHALDGVRRIMGPHLWCGPAADRFSSELNFHRQQLDRAAAQLRSTADHLRATAEAIDERLARETAARADAALRARADRCPAA